ncbi:CPBP family intramembrane metalloprotease [bacterium]|nr:CPBP family intramembrane metalloprotease [bacterium]
MILIIETQFLIPYLSKVTGWEAVIFWFVVAGLGLFLPLLITSTLILKNEGYRFNKKVWNERLRFKNMTRADWLWSIGAIVAIGILSAFIIEIIKAFVGEVNHQPPFMSFEPLTNGRYWILLIWFPYWLLNIMGEEILWRGTLLPRQEIVFGRFTWLFHGFFWGIFHIGFGWQLLITLLPILFIQSYVVQRQKNSWIGVIIHAGINGPSFIAISFGFI